MSTGARNVEYSLGIKDLPEGERPRERLLRHGSGVLSIPELLAILLRTGSASGSALELANQVLSAVGDLRNLVNIQPVELTSIRGVGAAKAAQLKAAVELGQRVTSSGQETRPAISCPGDASDLLMGEMRFLEKEHFRSLMLNVKNEVVGVSTISVGTLNSSLVHPRELFREAVRTGCAALVMVHNHPSGDPTPSDQDISLTHRMLKAGEVLGIGVLDHVIIGDGEYVSLKEMGFL